MTWQAEQTDPWEQLERRSSFERRYPSAEIRHMEYARLITEAAERHGLSETEYVRNLFEWDWEPPKSKAGNGDI
jgi:hypothetical protein